MNRLPDGELQQRWISAIEKHQQFVNNNGCFIICQRHFDVSDFITVNGRIMLKKNAVPSIFNNENKENENENNSSIQLRECMKCYDEIQKVKALQKNILEMDLKQQSEIQSHKHKIACLQNTNSKNILHADEEKKKRNNLAKINSDIKNELKNKTTTINALNDEIERLRSKYENSASSQNHNVSKYKIELFIPEILFRTTDILFQTIYLFRKLKRSCTAYEMELHQGYRIQRAFENFV